MCPGRWFRTGALGLSGSGLRDILWENAGKAIAPLRANFRPARLIAFAGPGGRWSESNGPPGVALSR